MLYGLANLAYFLGYSAFNTYVLFFYTEHLRLSPVAVGRAWFLFGIWNTVNDLVMGWLSDRAAARRGRTFFLILFAVPLGLAFALVWSPPGFVLRGGTTVAIAYFLIAISLYDVLQTAVNISQHAAFPEIASARDDRSRTSAIRQALGIVGTILGVAVSPLIYAHLGWAWLGILWGGAICAFNLLSLPGFRPTSGGASAPASADLPVALMADRPPSVQSPTAGPTSERLPPTGGPNANCPAAEHPNTEHLNTDCPTAHPPNTERPSVLYPSPERLNAESLNTPRPKLLSLFLEPTFLLYVGIQFSIRLALAFLQTLLPFFSRHVLGLSANQLSAAMGVMLVSAALAAPLWPRVLVRREVRTVAIGALSYLALLVASFLVVSDFRVLLGVMLLVGPVYAGLVMTLDLLFAQIVDQDFVRTGESRAGLFSGLVGTTLRFSPALAGLVIGEVLGASGFDPALPAQPGTVSVALRILMTVGPAMALVLAVGFLILYPLHGHRLREIEEAVKQQTSC